MDVKAASDLQKEILNLEESYFRELKDFFLKDEFLSPLLDLENWIKNNYIELNSWKKVNKCNLAVERIINYHIYSNFKDKKTGKNLISGVYASPVASDTAFETEDAIINIDAKTVNFYTNSGDWDQLEIGPNQSSFIHNNCYSNEEAFFSGLPVPFHAQAIDVESGKPNLSFILMLLYKDDGNSFEWHKPRNDNQIKLVSIPNGELSGLFDSYILKSVKTYKYETEQIIQKNGKLKTRVIKNKHIPDEFKPIMLNTKKAYYDNKKNKVWTIYESPLYSSVLSTDNIRVDFNILKDRLDSESNPWEGFFSWDIS